MDSSNQIGSIQAELTRRHKATARIVGMLLIGTAALALIALLAKSHLRQQANPSLDIALRITILIFGLGSVALRRTKFSAMRLQDIGALQGASGLLDTLEKTTLKVALLGATIALMGFTTTLLTGNEYYSFVASFLGVVVLLYCFPTRSSWERTLQRFAQNQESAGPPNPSVLTPQP